MGIIEFPIFTGDDLRQWIAWLEDFFVREKFTADEKLNLAQSLLEGEAESWFYRRQKAVIFQSWEQLKDSLLLRFGDFADPDRIRLNAKHAQLVKEMAAMFQILDRLEEDSITQNQVPVSNLEHSLQIDNESPNVCENSQDVVGCEHQRSILQVSHVKEMEEFTSQSEHSVLVNFETVVKKAKIQKNITQTQAGVGCVKNKNNAHHVFDELFRMLHDPGGTKVEHSDDIFEIEGDIDKVQSTQRDTVVEACDAEIDVLDGTATWIVTSQPVDNIEEAPGNRLLAVQKINGPDTKFLWEIVHMVSCLSLDTQFHSLKVVIVVLSIRHSLRNTRFKSRAMEPFVGFMTFQLKHKWRSKHLHTISALEFYISSVFPTVTSADSCSGYMRMNEHLQVHNLLIATIVNSGEHFTLELQVVATGEVLLFTKMNSLFITVMLLTLAAKYFNPFQVVERIGVVIFKDQPLPLGIAAVLDSFAPVFVIVILVVVDRLSKAVHILGLKHPFKPGWEIGVQQQGVSLAQLLYKDTPIPGEISTVLEDVAPVFVMPTGQPTMSAQLEAPIAGNSQVEILASIDTNKGYRSTPVAISTSHDVFPVSQLQAVIGAHRHVQSSDPMELLEGALWIPEAIVEERFDEVGRHEFLLKWLDHDASENSWIFSKDLVQLSPSFKLEDKLRLEGGSIVMTQQTYHRKNKKKLAVEVDVVARLWELKEAWVETEGLRYKEALGRKGGFAVSR